MRSKLTELFQSCADGCRFVALVSTWPRECCVASTAARQCKADRQRILILEHTAIATISLQGCVGLFFDSPRPREQKGSGRGAQAGVAMRRLVTAISVRQSMMLPTALVRLPPRLARRPARFAQIWVVRLAARLSRPKGSSAKIWII